MERGRANGEVQLGSDQDTESGLRHLRLLFSVWASSRKLCMEMPPLNNPPLLTSAQWSSHYVTSESTDGSREPAIATTVITGPLVYLSLCVSLRFFFFTLPVPSPFHSTSLFAIYSRYLCRGLVHIRCGRLWSAGREWLYSSKLNAYITS